jgi:outer membrane protein TolC
VSSAWHTPLKNQATHTTDCFEWWDEFGDPLLACLVEEALVNNSDVRLSACESKEKLLEKFNSVAAEVAQTYIEVRGMQQRLALIQESISLQDKIVFTATELLRQGFIDTIDHNEIRQNLETLFTQKTSLEFSIKKSIFHLLALLNDASENLYCSLSTPDWRLKEPSGVPLDSPEELVQRHPGIVDIRKMYLKTKNKQAFYHYQKKVSSVIEETETALAALAASSSKIAYQESVTRLKEETFHLIQDFFGRGQRDERDLFNAEQALLLQEDALFQAKIGHLINYVNLFKALSMGCESHKL